MAAAIFVLLPLGAVWASKRWRDPPREKWGIPPERLAAARQSPELVAYKRRIELGVGHGPAAAAVTRAIKTGTAAPPELRPAGPWVVRRERRRAEAAVTANAAT